MNDREKNEDFNNYARIDLAKPNLGQHTTMHNGDDNFSNLEGNAGLSITARGTGV